MKRLSAFVAGAAAGSYLTLRAIGSARRARAQMGSTLKGQAIDTVGSVALAVADAIADIRAVAKQREDLGR